MRAETSRRKSGAGHVDLAYSSTLPVEDEARSRCGGIAAAQLYVSREVGILRKLPPQPEALSGCAQSRSVASNAGRLAYPEFVRSLDSTRSDCRMMYATTCSWGGYKRSEGASRHQKRRIGDRV